MTSVFPRKPRFSFSFSFEAEKKALFDLLRSSSVVVNMLGKDKNIILMTNSPCDDSIPISVVEEENENFN